MPADPIVTEDLSATGGDSLSPFGIRDGLLRADLYREIRMAQDDRVLRGGEWGWYEIQPADVRSPDLVAYKVYGVDTLKWVIMIAAGLDDPRGTLEAGVRIFLPPTAWLYERIQHYRDLEAIER